MLELDPSGDTTVVFRSTAPSPTTWPRPRLYGHPWSSAGSVTCGVFSGDQWPTTGALRLRSERRLGRPVRVLRTCDGPEHCPRHSRPGVRDTSDVLACEMIEDYPDDKYGPSCIVLGFTTTIRPLHVQCSYPSRPIVKVITLYEPDPSRWLELKERRRDDG